MIVVVMRSVRSICAVVSLLVCSACVQLNTNPGEQDVSAEEAVVTETAADDSSSVAVRDSAAPRRRLPTLREQMMRIEEQQAAMQQDIGFIKNDIAVIRDELVQLREAVTTGKPTAVQTDAVKGPVPAAREAEDNDPPPATMLLSDEEAEAQGKTAKKKTSAAQTPAVQSQEPVGKKSAPSPPSVSQEVRRQSTAIPSDEALSGTRTPAARPQADKQPEPVSVSETYREAMNHIGKKDYAQAVPLLEDVLKNDKNPVTRGNAYYWLGEAAYAAGDYEKAIDQFRHAFSIKASTKADDALLMMAESYRKLGNNDEAKKTYNKLIQIYPQSEFVPRARKMLQML